MKVRLDIRKSALQNAERCFLVAKECARKEESIKAAIKQTQKELEEAQKEAEAEIALQPKMKRKKEWFEKYRWFYTSSGKLVVAGRDAKQNDLLVLRIMQDEDLFFHADIKGAPATILVGGKSASLQEKKEAAQFAASHSSGWKIGAAAVDVYAVEKGQLSKHASGGFIGPGGFAIEGKREWFLSVQLGLALGKEEGRVICLPFVHPKSRSLPVAVFPGNSEKGEAARKIAGIIGADFDEVLLALPSGKFLINVQK